MISDPPSVRFVGGDLSKDPVVRQEGSHFSVSCEASGYPEPTIEWTFTPAEKPEEDETPPPPSEVPSNFMITDGMVAFDCCDCLKE